MKAVTLSKFILAIAAGVVGLAGAERKAKSDTPAPSAVGQVAKIDVNTADLTTLESLPGIGPQTAKAIIAGRPYSSVDDLERVPGIGAARLKDLRARVTVGSRQSKAPERSSAKVPSPTGRVDLNTADLQTLESLPGVGPQIAREIVAARPFKSVDELEKVRGIGPARLKELQSMVTVSPASSAKSVRPARSQTTDDRSSTSALRTGRINLNTASREELEALPEIGPVKAQAIIDARPFTSIEDVMRVKGIKEGTFEVIKDKITVR